MKRTQIRAGSLCFVFINGDGFNDRYTLRRKVFGSKLPRLACDGALNEGVEFTPRLSRGPSAAT